MRALLIASVLVLNACGGDNDAAPAAAVGGRVPMAKLALKNFSASCGDFLNYAADALTEQYLQPFRCFGFGPCPVFGGGENAPPLTPTPTASDNAGGTPTRGSDTNTQEAGVDEADIVKRDGGLLYILSGRTLNVLQAFPPAGLENRSISTLKLATDNDSFYGRDFFVDATAKRLVVLGDRYTSRPESLSVIVDISNPAAPIELTRLGVQGSGLEARRVGNRVHRVSRFDVPPPDWFFDNNDALVQKRQDYQNALGRGDQSSADAIKAEVRTIVGQRVAAAGADSLLPKLSEQHAGGSVVESTLPCSAIAHPDVVTGMGVALIDSFDTGGMQRAVSGVINNAYIVYGSVENLYLAQSSSGWFFGPQQAEETAIYKLALSTTGAAAYQGVGSVAGSILGSYALSEFNGDLRVASTETNFNGSAANTLNHVSILRAAAPGNLSQIGAVRGLAPGERIQGVRFIGDKGYVVTFRQVDPLFALDLSNPAQPRVTDELKIPGFSSYLLPLGNTHLLTIGRAGDEQQLNGQVAIQLFDVSNPANIRQVASLTPDIPGSGGSYSAAEYDPHAFTYFADNETSAFPGTLSVPLHAYDHNSGEGFAGFLVVRVNPAGSPALAEAGRISHNGFTQPGGGCSGGGSAQTFAPCRDAYYSADPRRSVFMQDAQGTYLFTISALGVIASDANAPSVELGRKPLPFDEPPCCYAFPTDDGGAATASPG